MHKRKAASIYVNVKLCNNSESQFPFLDYKSITCKHTHLNVLYKHAKLHSALVNILFLLKIFSFYDY